MVSNEAAYNPIKNKYASHSNLSPIAPRGPLSQALNKFEVSYKNKKYDFSDIFQDKAELDINKKGN